MATHTIIYYGRYSLNHTRLVEDPGNFQRKQANGQLVPVASPSANVNGICFGCMEKTGYSPSSERFVAVKVEDIVLDIPIVLDPPRHTDGKNFGPQASLFGDDSARTLLTDIINANHDQADALTTIYDRHFTTALRPDTFTTEEINEIEAQTYFEGAVKEILVNSYERSADARQKCLEEYGYLCQICKFDFLAAYGEAGRDFIHVHHLVPLAEIGENYEVDPTKDLLPVCPNCHAIIHRRREPYTPDQVRQFIRNAQAK